MRKMKLGVWVACLSLAAVAAFAAESGASPGGDRPVRKRIELFNGKDFAGWTFVLRDKDVDPASVWSVRDGVVHCKGQPYGYMRTTKDYGDFRLTYEWRWVGKGTNSGCLVFMTGEDKVMPACIEAQLGSGRAGDALGLGGASFKELKAQETKTIRVPRTKDDVEKPIGEWNRMVVVCKGASMEVWVNGEHVNKATECVDPDGKTLAKGKICLQSEGGPIEFRNIVLEPLK